MKRILLALIIAIATIFPAMALSDEYSVQNPEIVGAKDIGIERFHNIVVVYRIQMGEKNIVEVYRPTPGDKCTELEPLFAFREISTREYEPISKPSHALLYDADGETTRLEQGQIKYLLSNGIVKKVNRDNKLNFIAYADFLANPEEYPEFEGVKIYPNHAEELYQSYENKIKEQQNARLKRKAIEKQENNDFFKWFEIALLVPFVLMFITYHKTNNAKMAAGFHRNMVIIALEELFAAIMIGVAIYGFWGSNWPWIVLGVVIMLAIMVTTVFFGMNITDHLKFARHGKFPWIPAVIFGLLGAYILFLAPAFIGSLFVMDSISVETKPLDLILGYLLSIGVLIAVGYWYYKAITKDAPQLGHSFFWIALSTILTIGMGLLLIIIIISIYVFKGVGKMALEQSDKDGTNERGCNTCRYWDGNRCSVYGTVEKVTNCQRHVYH